MSRLAFILTGILLVFQGCTSKKNDNPLTANNVAPTLEITGFAADTLVFVPQKFYKFEFVAKDEVTEIPKVSTKVLGNSGTVDSLDHISNGRFVALFRPTGKGAHTIEISVTDGLETTTGVITAVFGDNKNPVAVIQYVELVRDANNIRFTYEFDASDSKDRDSKIVMADWDLDGISFQDDIQTKPQHTFTYYKDYQIQLTVEDEYGARHSTSMIIGNSRPRASFVIRPESRARNGAPVTLDATASTSPHGAIANYMWVCKDPDQGLDVLAETNSSIYRFDVRMRVGDNKIGLVVSDTEANLSDTTWATLTIDNQAPVANFSFSTALENIRITGNQSTDTDPGDSLTLTWSLNGIPQHEKANEMLPSFDIPGAVYQLTLTVTDNHDEFSEITKTVSVPGRPVAQFDFPGGVDNNFAITNGPTITLDGRRSEAGNESAGVETFEWLLRPAGKAIQTLSQGSSSFIQLPVNHPVGDYEIGLKITNLEGLPSVTAWKNLTVLNSNPEAKFQCEFKAFADGLVYRILSNESRDPDPADKISYSWFLDGVEQTNTTGATPTFTRSHSAAVSAITLRVTDTNGGLGEKTVNGNCN